MSVIPETATVYRGGGRRWFTLKAAKNAEARAAIKKRCECCKGDVITAPYTCYYHEDPARYARMIRLYGAMFVKISALTPTPASPPPSQPPNAQQTPD